MIGSREGEGKDVDAVGFRSRNDEEVQSRLGIRWKSATKNSKAQRQNPNLFYANRRKDSTPTPFANTLRMNPSDSRDARESFVVNWWCCAFRPAVKSTRR
jgi:hypothetical protein